MSLLTAAEIAVLLDALGHKYGPGYSAEVVGGVRVGALQAKLSVMAEAVARREAAAAPPAAPPSPAAE